MWSVPVVCIFLNTSVPRVGAVELYEDIELSNLQPENAHLPIEVTPSGMLIEVSEEHPRNAPAPIEVTVDGILTEVSQEQPSNALAPIEGTPSGILIEVSDLQ